MSRLKPDIKGLYIPFPGVNTQKETNDILNSIESKIAESRKVKVTDVDKLEKYHLDFLYTVVLIVDRFKIGSSLVKNNGGPGLLNHQLIDILVKLGEEHLNIDKSIVLQYVNVGLHGNLKGIPKLKTKGRNKKSFPILDLSNNEE